jgi:hypothetical protein
MDSSLRKIVEDLGVVPREQNTQFESFCGDLPQNKQGAYKKIIICQIGKKVQRDVCRGAESARSNFQCSRERLLVHEQNRTLWQQ